jgi:hypothetical protein
MTNLFYFLFLTSITLTTADEQHKLSRSSFTDFTFSPAMRSKSPPQHSQSHNEKTEFEVPYNNTQTLYSAQATGCTTEKPGFDSGR